jgi:hypothetical protein
MLEFAAVFLTAVCWDLFQKNRASAVDAFGIAFFAALLLYAFHSK